MHARDDYQRFEGYSSHSTRRVKSGLRRRKSLERRYALELLEPRVVLSSLGTPTMYSVTLTGSSPTDGSGTSGTLPYVVAQANVNTNPAGSEITFDGTVFASDQTITLGATLELSESDGPEVIDGPGVGLVTVSGGDTVSVFKIDDGVTASLSGMTISGGSTAGNGGGVLNYGTATFTGVTISQNVASASTSYGAGLENEGTATLVDCTISGNSAPIGIGGGLANRGTLTLTGCMISGNSGYFGGGISNGGLSIETMATLTDCTFVANAAAFGGGFCNLGDASLDGCDFTLNSAQTSGGGVSNFHGGQATLSGCNFKDNFAGSFGGGISVDSGSLTIELASSLTGNSTNTGGGAIAVRVSASLTVTDVTISGNTAAQLGGGIFNSGTATVTDSQITDNSAGQAGGGLGSESTATLTGCTISGNSSQDGGGLASNGPLTVTDCTISGNSAMFGGGLFDVGNATLDDCDFSSNVAGSLGGAVSISLGGKVSISGGNFSGNSAAVNGGGIGLTSGSLTIEQASFIGNSAGNEGGGIAVLSAGSVSMTGGSFADNNAVRGGGVYNSGTFVATGTTFVGNSASIGAGLLSAGTANLEGCDFSSNSAGSTGGGASIEGGQASFSGCTFSANYAGTDGAGIAVTAGALTIANSSVTDNVGSLHGGGILVSGFASLTMTDVNVTGNFAVNGGGLSNSGTLIMNGGSIDGNSATYGAGLFNEGGDATLSQCMISGNSAEEFGGGILNQASLTVDGSDFTSNFAGTTGGGISSHGGTASLSGCTFNSNSAGMYGGGISVYDGVLSIQFSSLSGNSAGLQGGGVEVWSGGTLTLNASTISGNTAPSGGGVFNDGVLYATNCTIAYNDATYGGGLDSEASAILTACTISGNSASALGAGIYDKTHPSDTTLTDTIVAGNNGPDGADDINGTAANQVTGSYNLIGTGGSGGIINGTDNNIVLTDLANLHLGALANYGGQTETMALLSGSAAIGKGTTADFAGTTNPVSTDQRGEPLDSPVPDIGAFQTPPPGVTTTTVTPPTDTVSFGQSALFTATVSSNDGAPPDGAVQFFVNGVDYGSPVPISDGTAQITISDEPVGSYTITAEYTGDSSFDATLPGGETPAALTVNKAVTTTTVTPTTDTVSLGQSAMFTATVSSTDGAPPDGTVQFFVNSVAYGSPATISDGIAHITISDEPIGSYTVTAEYTGDTSFAATLAGGETSAALTVAKFATSTAVTPTADSVSFGQSPTFTATVSSDDGAPDDGTVQFFVNGVAYGSPVAVSSGVAHIAVSRQPAGSFAITAKYLGDADLAATLSAAETSAALTVTQLATTTTVTPGTGSVVVGASATFTASVSSAIGAPSGGSVQFLVNGVDYGSPVAISGGQAQIAITEPVGSFTVTAKYTGNANYAATLPAAQTAGTLVVNTPAPIPTQSVIFGEQPIFQRKLNQKHKPVGKAVLTGFDFDFNVPLNAASASSNTQYQLDSITTKKVKHKKVTVLHAITNFKVNYLAASDEVEILLGSKQTFPTGGQFTVLGGLTTESGAELTGNAVFSIFKGGKGVVQAS